jgi:hypothetical protein
LFPKIRVPSDDENMHENTQEDEKNPAVKAAKTTLYAKSKLAINTWALTLKPYQKDGSRAKTVMTMALPTSPNKSPKPALTMMQGASRQGPDEDQDGPLRHGGGGGHNLMSLHVAGTFRRCHYPQLPSRVKLASCSFA